MLTHKGTQMINTEKLILRSFRLEDAEPMFTNWANDSEVTKYLMWKPHGCIETTRDILKLWVDSYKIPDTYNWAIECKDSGEPIGSIGIVHTDESCRACEVGYCISKKHWGKGIVAEALNGIIEYLFCEIGYNRIYAIHDTQNPNSGKVMQKCGMKFEGTMRQAKIRNNEELYDISMYAILKEEWGK